MADLTGSASPSPEPQSEPRAPIDTLVAGAAMGDAAARMAETAAFFLGSMYSPFSETPPTAGVEVAPSATPPVGQFFHKFELLEMRGGGGMGVVFKARDTKLNRIIALKTLRNTILPNSDELERFHREARAISQLAHPHIVPLLEFSEFRGTPYYVMHLAEGGTLASWRKARRQPAERIAAVVEKIALAVDYAHRQGVVHRDIKPGNVLLTADGEPMLADFGLARVNDSSHQLTPTDFLLGTPTYMAPEQLQGSQVDGRADIWSLGVMLYELLTGAPPFEDQDRAALFVKIATHTPARMITPEGPVDRGLERIVLRCLEKQPEDRYQTAEQLAADLAGWQRGEIPSQTWMEWASRWGRRVRRHPVLAAGFMLSLGLTIFLTPILLKSLDEYGPIRQQLSALARGESCTLIGPVGGPKWHRSFPPDKLLLTVTRDAPFRITSAVGSTYLELVPGPLPLSYRVEVEFPRESDFQEDDERGLCLCTTLVDGDEVRQLTGLAVLMGHFNHKPGEGRAWMEVRHLEQRISNGRIDTASFVFSQNQMVLYGQGKDSWHHLVVEVTPEGITARLDGHVIGTVSPMDEVKALGVLHRQVGTQGTPMQPVLSRTGGAGVLIKGTDLRVRNFIITPLN